jgi:glycerate 2-kinase
MTTSLENPKSRHDATTIFESALAAADPGRCVARVVSCEDAHIRLGDERLALAQISKIVAVGAGKATPAMAVSLEEILGDRISQGTINTKYGHALALRHIETVECGHPIPDAAGVRGTERMRQYLSQLDEAALVIALFSGGGSALLPAPVDGVTLEEKQDTTQALLDCGATIDELNALRKHLSTIKGGRMSDLAYPATVHCLVLSDVIGDQLETIASGPTHPDSTTFADCMEIVRRYDIYDKLPSSVRGHLESGVGGAIAETPGPNDECFARTSTKVIGNNSLAIEAARETAYQLGYRTLVLSTRLQGEAREVATMLAAVAQEISVANQPVCAPACVISGGETTVTIRGDGKGGRNQELALAAAVALKGWIGVTLLSGGTDGTDGPTDAAGAIVDGSTLERARGRGLEAQPFLDRNDSYHFFRELGDLVITGPTNTNVMDLQILLVN